MKNPDLVLEILNNASHVIQRCARCPADSVQAMTEAATEIDLAFCNIVGVGQSKPPPGEGGVPVALFFFIGIRDKAQSLLDSDIGEREADSLQQILRSMAECVKSFPV